MDQRVTRIVTNSLKQIFGYYYPWEAISGNQSIAPDGWRVPTDDDFIQLEQYLGLTLSQSLSTSDRGTNQGSQLAGYSNLWNDGALKEDSEFGASGFNAPPS